MSTAVGLNLLWARTGLVGGSEEYVVRQLQGLAEIDHELAITAYVLPGFAEAHHELTGVRWVAAPVSGRSRPRRVAAEHTWLARRTRGDALELVHHSGGTVPAVGRGPRVLTLHDLQWNEMPQYVSRAKLAYLRAATPRSVLRAAIVTTPSEFVKRSVVATYGVDPDRVVTVRHGVGPGFGARATDEATLRRRYRLGTAPIVVYPAMTHPHKRHDLLVDLLAGPWDDVVLVLPGAAGAAEESLRRHIAERGVESRVVRPGRVPAADRDGLIRMAVALAFPSEYEGFGAPALEAMALGTPVIASDRAALPEVVGDAGVLRPLTLDAWAGALAEADARRAELTVAGRERAGAYTTRASGQDLLGAYRRVLS